MCRLTDMTATRKTILNIVLTVLALVPSGNIYAECVYGDCENGLGSYIWPGGDAYTGEWRNGRPEGQGRFTWPEGDAYIGEWTGGRNEGHGRYIAPPGATLYLVDLTDGEVIGPGCIQGDCANGYGAYTWLSGAKYIGSFENGERNGPGTFSFPNGLTIKGIWSNDRYVGKTPSQSTNWGG